MKGDFSRLTFDPKKHFSSVRMQQGRVQLDSDWNEQLDITNHRLESEVTDFVGPSGFPADAQDQSSSFQVTAEGEQLYIGPGRGYLEGRLFVNEARTSLTHQPDFPGATLPETAGRYLVYLESWQRHITALEEPAIRESALGGPDTATRVKNVWQVRLGQVNEGTSAVDLLSTAQLRQLFADKFSNEREARYLALSSGRLQARMNSIGVTLENQLYRVEIQTGGAPQQATFKWSRDNGSVAARVAAVEGATITIDTSSGSAYTDFAPGQWVELSTQAQTLRGEPGILAQLQSVQGDQLVVAWPDGIGRPETFDIARRWDTPQGQISVQPAADLAAQQGWILLEDEIEVRFDLDADTFYKSGDYWLIPARSLTGRIEWPLTESGEPLLQAPHGIQRQYAALALVDRQADGSWQIVDDLRTRFKPITVGLLSKAGDTVEGSLRIVDNLEVYGAMSGDPAVGELVVEGNLKIKGALEVAGGATQVVEQRMSGDVALGDNDRSNVTIYGLLRSGHSSRRLQVGVPLHANEPLTVSARLGIGLDTPEAALDIKADQQLPLRIRSASPDGAQLTLENTSPNGRAWNLTVTGANNAEGAGHLRFNPAQVIITRTGNVGIGTTNPAYTLQVGDHQTQGAWKLAVAGRGSTGDWRQWTLRTGDGNNATDIRKLRIRDEQGGADRVVIDEHGNVGLGADAPGAKLEVKGSFKAASTVSGEREIYLEAPSAGNHRGDSNSQNGTGLVYRVKENPANGDPIFQVRSSGQAIRFFVEHEGWTGSKDNSAWFGGSRANYFAGNVGLKTNDPKDALDIHGVLRFNGNVDQRLSGEVRAERNTLVLDGHWDALEVKGRVIDWSGSNLHIGFDNNHADHYIELGRNVGQLRFLSGGGASESMRITGGRVGIGTTEPGATLAVNGPIMFGGNEWQLDTGSWQNANIRYHGSAASATFGFHGLDSKSVNLIVDGDIQTAGALRMDGNRSAHLDVDGAMYRYSGQVYITVDDNLYIRDTDGNITAHFNTNSREIRGKIWCSDEYTWSQGQDAVKMEHSSKCVAFLTYVQGQFEGGGEAVGVEVRSDGYWYLYGKSGQRSVMAKARCIGMP